MTTLLMLLAGAAVAAYVLWPLRGPFRPLAEAGEDLAERERVLAAHRALERDRGAGRPASPDKAAAGDGPDARVGSGA